MKGEGGRIKGEGGRMKDEGGRMKGEGGRMKGEGGRMKGEGGRMKGGRRVTTRSSRAIQIRKGLSDVFMVCSPDITLFMFVALI